MITDNKQEQFGRFLNLIAEELDVPEEMYGEAKEKYECLGEWLRADHENQYRSDAEIYAQGSMQLGTAVRPIKEGDKYDVDLVYRRDIQKTSVTQEMLKEQVGDQLRRYIEYLRRENKDVPDLVPSRRCWVLDYPGKFHMDVLPALPDDEASLYNQRDLADAIIITDKKLQNWKHSNPRGYKNWFQEQEKILLFEKRAALAAEAMVDVEKFPLDRVKTPLRRTIQMLKRHRDIRYQGHPDDKPISIIITTLAAQAYAGQTFLMDALTGVISEMLNGVEKRAGEYWVANPVNHDENFADKWSEEPQRAERFFEWLKQVEIDFKEAAEQTGMHRIAERLSTVLGEGLVKGASERYGREIDSKHQSGELKMAAKTGVLGAVGTSVKKNTWYGA